MVGKERPLELEPLRFRLIVGILPREKRAARELSGASECGCDPLRVLSDEHESAIVPDRPADDVSRPIARAVIDDHALEIGESLALERSQGGPDRRGRIPHGQENGDLRHP
jgi:hypothetical protein